MNHTASARFWRCYDSLPAEVRALADKNFQLLLGDDAHCVPRWPLSLVQDQGATALAVGATDYTVTPLRPLPRPLV